MQCDGLLFGLYRNEVFVYANLQNSNFDCSLFLIFRIAHFCIFNPKMYVCDSETNFLSNTLFSKKQEIEGLKNK